MNIASYQARLSRFRDTTGALSFRGQPAESHPDACGCNDGDATPHVHYAEAPYKCARCCCASYHPRGPFADAFRKADLTDWNERLGIVKEHPIIFSAPMVRAILEGRKTQTRRAVGRGNSATGVPRKALDWNKLAINGARPDKLSVGNISGTFNAIDARWKVGDRLWVRETWTIVDSSGTIAYRSTDEARLPPCRWRSPLHMLRSASRLTLQVVAVRPERLQSISESDARAEGATPTPEHISGHPLTPHRQAFYCLWQQLNEKRASWMANPVVWVITFQKVDP
jgi:hypothetical protein